MVPAIAPDGTIYTVSRAHRNAGAYLVAAHPDLTPAGRAAPNDGCGVIVPTTPNGSRAGAHIGVNRRPPTSLPGASSTSRPSPVVLTERLTLRPTLLLALLRPTPTAAFASYDFGWDITPAVFRHDGTYSIVTKDNHYSGPTGDERYDLSSLDANLVPEWTLTNTNTESCARQPDGSIVCVDDHPEGFEWCVNQPVVDAGGVVYANSEDGYLYAILPDGTVREKIFLNLALGAAYTPVSIGATAGSMPRTTALFVIGFPVESRATAVAPAGSGRHTSVVPRP
jgi:hypothetical protein